MRGLVLLGGGGHCLSCIEAIESSGTWAVAGILDPVAPPGSSLLGHPFLGPDTELPTLLPQIPDVLVTVGQLRDASIRIALYRLAVAAGATMAVVVAKSASVSRHAVLGPGTVALHGVRVNAEARIGENCILNTGAILEHNCAIGPHTHVSTGAIINGDCVIGSEVLVGSGAVIRNGVSVCDRAIVGAGAVVVADIDEPGIWAGVPARRLR